MTFSALLSLCEGNSPVTGGFPSQRLVTRSFDAFFNLRLNKRLSKQSRRRWFAAPLRSLWRHCNIIITERWCLTVDERVYRLDIASIASVPSIKTDLAFTGPGVGLLTQFPPFRYYSVFTLLPNHWLPKECIDHILQVLPYLSWGKTSQSNKTDSNNRTCSCCKIKYLHYEEINERALVIPIPVWLNTHINWKVRKR